MRFMIAQMTGTWLFVQQIVEANTNKPLHCYPFVSGIEGD